MNIEMEVILQMKSKNESLVEMQIDWAKLCEFIYFISEVSPQIKTRIHGNLLIKAALTVRTEVNKIAERCLWSLFFIVTFPVAVAELLHIT